MAPAIFIYTRLTDKPPALILTAHLEFNIEQRTVFSLCLLPGIYGSSMHDYAENTDGLYNVPWCCLEKSKMTAIVLPRLFSFKRACSVHYLICLGSDRRLRFFSLGDILFNRCKTDDASTDGAHWVYGHLLVLQAPAPAAVCYFPRPDLTARYAGISR